jgi:hypothetical protein
MADSTPVIGFQEMMKSIDLGPGTQSIQFQFARLQLLLSELNKSKATSYMDEISTSQEEAKKCAKMIQDALKLKGLGRWTSDATGTNYEEPGATYNREAKAIKAYCEANGITFTVALNANNWETIISSLKSHQETLGTDTSQKMVFVQDFMGQYNSYLTGANTAIQQANQTLQTIARGQ